MRGDKSGMGTSVRYPRIDDLLGLGRDTLLLFKIFLTTLVLMPKLVFSGKEAVGVVLFDSLIRRLFSCHANKFHAANWQLFFASACRHM